MKLTIEEFQVFRDFIHQKTGILFRDEKMIFVQNRLEARFAEIGCDNMEEYLRILKYDAKNEEMNALIEMLTTNETYFFRNLPQLEGFGTDAVPKMAARKKENNSQTIRIWSAGCSTGEEPYTLAMLVAENAPGMDIRIIATDINQRVLGIAKKGIYSGRSLKDVPQNYLNKYFVRQDQYYEVTPEIKAMIDFWTLNMVDKDKMRMIYNIDFIFCRNVIIYFSQDISKQIMSCFYDSLNKGGVVFLGHSESMHFLSAAFKLVKYKDSFGYMKE
jgi:chemotaxis protein methyltransferase CheR